MHQRWFAHNPVSVSHWPGLFSVWKTTFSADRHYWVREQHRASRLLTIFAEQMIPWPAVNVFCLTVWICITVYYRSWSEVSLQLVNKNLHFTSSWDRFGYIGDKKIMTQAVFLPQTHWWSVLCEEQVLRKCGASVYTTVGHQLINFGSPSSLFPWPL